MSLLVVNISRPFSHELREGTLELCISTFGHNNSSVVDGSRSFWYTNFGWLPRGGRCSLPGGTWGKTLRVIPGSVAGGVWMPKVRVLAPKMADIDGNNIIVMRDKNVRYVVPTNIIVCNLFVHMSICTYTYCVLYRRKECHVHTCKIHTFLCTQCIILYVYNCLQYVSIM